MIYLIYFQSLLLSHIEQLAVHRCMECGQPLPESYQPPSDEEWTTGIFGCAEDPESCKSFICFNIMELTFKY